MTVQAQISEKGSVGFLRATSDNQLKIKSECKATSAFRTISEVATNLDVPQHVLRFWETKFHQIRPLKRGGGRRYYRPEDVDLLTSIKELLYSKGMTIRGVQKLLSEGGRTGGTRLAALSAAMPPLNRISETSSSSVQNAVSGGAISQETISTTGLPQKSRREMEAVLGELKSLRELLRQVGI